MVTRLRPKDEDDEIDLTPETRATAPSIVSVSSRSTVSAAAPSKVVVTVITGAVDVRQFADLDAVEGGEAGDRDQRVQHEGHDRPADEQRGEAGVAGGVDGSGHEPSAVVGGARLLAGDADLAALADALRAFGDHHVAAVDRRRRSARSRCCAG